MVSRSTAKQAGGTRPWSSPPTAPRLSAYQTGNEYVVEINAEEGAPAARVAMPVLEAAPRCTPASRVTFNFQDVPVRTVLQLIAEESGLNIVAADTVQRQRDAAPDQRAVGPGAGHRAARQVPRPAP